MRKAGVRVEVPAGAVKLFACLVGASLVVVNMDHR